MLLDKNGGEGVLSVRSTFVAALRPSKDEDALFFRLARMRPILLYRLSKSVAQECPTWRLKKVQGNSLRQIAAYIAFFTFQIQRSQKQIDGMSMCLAADLRCSLNLSSVIGYAFSSDDAG